MNVVYVATSLDGFIARVDGSLDWLENVDDQPAIENEFTEFLKNIDAIIMGRKTFETVLNFECWPYNKPVFVLSNTMKELPSKLMNFVEIVNGDLNDILTDFRTRGYRNIYVDGGKTIQSFLMEDLIDDMIISTVPIILGRGISLFGETKTEKMFKCIKIKLISPYLIQHHYIRDR